MARTRTDIHRPSAPEFDPEAYVCIGVFDLHPEEGDNRWRTQKVERLRGQGFEYATHQTIGQCGHCGARIRYAALLTHAETKQIIYVGETCLDNRFESLTAAEFKRLRESAKLNRERQTKKDLFAQNLAAAIALDPLAAVLGDAEALDNLPPFVSDIASKLDRWELSERQVAAVAKVVRQDAERKAQRAAEAETATPVPITKARIKVTGEVLTTKWQDSQYGGSLKMLVKSDEGFKVWGTVPGAISYIPLLNEGGRAIGSRGLEKGDRVTFTAKVEPSGDDATFGFFSRPTQASLIEQKELVNA